MDPIKLLGDLDGSEISEVQFLPSSQAGFCWVVLGWGWGKGTHQNYMNGNKKHEHSALWKKWMVLKTIYIVYFWEGFYFQGLSYIGFRDGIFIPPNEW